MEKSEMGNLNGQKRRLQVANQDEEKLQYPGKAVCKTGNL